MNRLINKALSSVLLFSLICFSVQSHAGEKETKAFYDKLVRVVDGKKMITVSVFFGFLEMIVDDNRSKLIRQRLEGALDWGPGEKKKLKTALLESCDGKDHARCGYISSNQDDDILFKKVQLFGEEIVIRVRLRSVTKTTSDHSSSLDSRLTALGEQWEQELRSAMKRDSAVLILSHSRHGGGPDPFYPVISPEGRIRYMSYYIKAKRGLKLITDEYTPNGQNQILLVGACLSSKYFSESIYNRVHELGKPREEFLFVSTRRNLNLVDFHVAAREILSGLARGEGPSVMSSAWPNHRDNGPDTCFKFEGNWAQ